MRILRHKEDALPVALITGLFLLDLCVYFFVNDLLLVAVWALLGLGPKACICAWNHHHQHCPTFHSSWMNRLLEVVYALHTGITTHAWVLHHNLGHHLNYLDQTKDESGWMRKDGSTMGCAEYTWVIAITGYFRAFQVGRNHPKYKNTFLVMALLIALLVALLIWYKPAHALIIFVVPMFVGYTITCWHTYYHHAGLHSDNHFEASYNVTHRWYNRLTGNLGYHTAHHMKQGVHWSKLPALHETIKDKIPDRLYRKPCIPFCWMPG